MSREGSDAPVWDTDYLRTATGAAGIGLWSWNVDNNQITMDARANALHPPRLGLPTRCRQDEYITRCYGHFCSPSHAGRCFDDGHHCGPIGRAILWSVVASHDAGLWRRGRS